MMNFKTSKRFFNRILLRAKMLRRDNTEWGKDGEFIVVHRSELKNMSKIVELESIS